MRMFAATSPDAPTVRAAVPADLLRRLAFGRPARRAIQPAQPAAPSTVRVEAPAVADDAGVELDQRVRQSGEW